MKQTASSTARYSTSQMALTVQFVCHRRSFGFPKKIKKMKLVIDMIYRVFTRDISKCIKFTLHKV